MDSINRDEYEDIFESLGLENRAPVEGRKTVNFEITNDAYEYSGLLRRMMESSRNSIS